MIERMNHEHQKQHLTGQINDKIKELKILQKDCTDENLNHYYMGYIRAYKDCIRMIQEDKEY